VGKPAQSVGETNQLRERRNGQLTDNTNQPVDTMAELFRAMAAPDDEDYRELDVEVKSGDGRHYFVALTVKNKGIWLEPEAAYELIDELCTAAAEAERKTTDKAGDGND
jgi:hypothetical protein